MRKEYFFVNPSNFARVGEIDIDGNYEYIQCKDFKVNEPRENYIFFEVRYDYYEDNKKVFAPVAREIITGKKFNLNVRERQSRRTDKWVQTVELSSEELGLYSKIMSVSDIEREKLSQLSGIFRHFQENPEDKENYCLQLKVMFEEAKEYKSKYDQTVDGPSKALIGQARRTYRRTKIGK